MHGNSKLAPKLAPPSVRRVLFDAWVLVLMRGSCFAEPADPLHTVTTPAMPAVPRCPINIVTHYRHRTIRQTRHSSLPFPFKGSALTSPFPTFFTDSPNCLVALHVLLPELLGFSRFTVPCSLTFIDRCHDDLHMWAVRAALYFTQTLSSGSRSL